MPDLRSIEPVSYPVSEVFKSFQGEGHFVGYPMTFVRLAGCSNLGCSIRRECDESPWKARSQLNAYDVVAAVENLQADGIVCITGGEPTDHDLVPLVSELITRGYRVHLETSGMRPVVGLPLEWLTVSPKGDDYKQRTGHALKVVVRPEWGWEEVDQLDHGTQFFHRYLQPLTNLATGKPENLMQVIEMLKDGTWNKNARWALGSQFHRYWSVK